MDELQVLTNAVRGLPEEQRQAFTLHYIFELGLAEIARRLHMTPEHAEHCIAAAFATLREKLASYFE